MLAGPFLQLSVSFVMQLARPAVVVAAVGILGFTGTNGVVVGPHRPDIYAWPPTPEMVTIDADTLAEKFKVWMPEFTDGFVWGLSFRPKNAAIVSNATEPETRLFEDPYLQQFLLIAPQSSRLFKHNEVLKGARTAFPYCAIGKVLMRDGEQTGACSGALVGMNLLLTAAHCTRSNVTQSWSLEFVPGFDAEDLSNPRPWGSAFAERCISVRHSAGDYAVCQLHRSFSECGYLGWNASLSNSYYLERDWSSVGYPANYKSGNVATRESGIKLQMVEDSAGESGMVKMLSSQTYVDKGWSGGPLFGQTGDEVFVVGVVAAIANNGYDHIFATSSQHFGGESMCHLIVYGLNEWKASEQE
ncbi:trypsin-like cysteine/serine peptidase domain-containing protein [Lasiosphaeris hirsuta]|uniref:Trypsin-like cysteine/serine peptidase domain-containing protein n=1 Tax=Lasiosphaeris hirsuta TaxID=260670 RepID=A0AA40EC73_9PEZI|nr:trypsin-like cysteine/serine peptidase domain-containing protein [Lasiosphaeris hirsuta]